MFRDISAIDARLTTLEQEKQQLIALRKKLQISKPTPPVSDSFSPEQKIAIFRNLFRGRTDIFANRWQNQQGRSGYSVACNNAWVQGICNKPRIKCQDCNHCQFSELLCFALASWDPAIRSGQPSAKYCVGRDIQADNASNRCATSRSISLPSPQPRSSTERAPQRASSSITAAGLSSCS